MNLLIFLITSAFDFGITVAIVGFGIVLGSLALLVFIFSKLPGIINYKMNRKKVSQESEISAKENHVPMEGNVSAAISLALHLYFSELHDEESNIVTIKKVRKAYSPWSSKIYSVTQNWPKN